MNLRKSLGRLSAIGVSAAALVLMPSAAHAAPIVDQTLPGPIGGAEICVAGTCVPVQGVTNVRIVVDVAPGTLTPPGVSTGSAPGCTGNINAAVFATTPGISASSLIAAVTFNYTDKNGNVVSPTQTLGGPAALPAVPGMTIPVASVCGALL